jgi:putative pyruvate formate lyase activating enzyme
MECNLCGHRCSIDRASRRGFCGLDDGVYVSFYGPHFGEEPYLVGRGGSGTVFFLGCNLRCLFCQNHQISRWTGDIPLPRRAEKTSADRLADIFFELKDRGCENINLVSPTPYAREIAAAVEKARARNLELPLVYNSHGYDSVEALSIMKGLVDVYLPDLKYCDSDLGERYSGVPHYYETASAALDEMFAQVGHLSLNSRGMAVRGLAVRHLVLPENIENSMKALERLARYGPEISISLMSQYHPLHELPGIPDEIRRTLHGAEYRRVVDHAVELGLEHCLIQELDSHDEYLPDFDRQDTFGQD